MHAFKRTSRAATLQRRSQQLANGMQGLLHTVQILDCIDQQRAQAGWHIGLVHGLNQGLYRRSDRLAALPFGCLLADPEFTSQSGQLFDHKSHNFLAANLIAQGFRRQHSIGAQHRLLTGRIQQGVVTHWGRSC